MMEVWIRDSGGMEGEELSTNINGEGEFAYVSIERAGAVAVEENRASRSGVSADGRKEEET